MISKPTGIILAGGKSRRMGTEKGLALFRGKPLISYAIEIFQGHVSEILVSTNSDSFSHLGLKTVPDVFPDCGPMGGIYSCLKQSDSRMNLVLSCDMPFVNFEIFRHLAEQIGDAWICVPWHEEDRYEPLCGIYLKDSLADLHLFMNKGNFKLPDLFQATNFRAARISDIQPPPGNHFFMSMNSPSDLEIAGQ